VQRRLDINPTGVYDRETEAAVRMWQDSLRLIADGKVGPVTRSMLVGGSVRYELKQPKYVLQGDAWRCWAAALESALASPKWPKPSWTMTELETYYKKLLNKENKSISPAGFTEIGKQLGFGKVSNMGMRLRAERLIRALRSQAPLILITIGSDAIGHARVLYGVHVTGEGINLMVMDPLSGYGELPMGDIQDATNIGVIGPS
jgi:peptidoglycan hydrolase-like protein with peptidoglycan-binding domain